jgi:hypothetical protein
LVVKAPNKNLVTEMDYPVAVCDTVLVKYIQPIPSIENSFLYDFGQNASGIVELEVKGNKGDTWFLPLILNIPNLQVVSGIRRNGGVLQLFFSG